MSAGSIRTSSGRPTVIVPVLSRMSDVTRARTSSAAVRLTMIFWRAARFTPPIRAIGTARISGHGVATTSTASARSSVPLYHQAPAASPTAIAENTTL